MSINLEKNSFISDEQQLDDLAPYDATKSKINWNPQVTTHPILGWIGAVVGITIGAALWVLIAQIGYIVGIIGAGTILLGILGYRLLSRDSISLICLVIMLIIAAFAIFLAEIIGCAISVDLGLSLGDSMNLIFSIIKEYPEIRTSFIIDLLIGYAFLGAGVYWARKYDWI